MNKLILATAAAAAICAAAPTLAMAQDQTASQDGVYGDLGWSHSTTNGASTEGIQGRVGGRFGRYFGVEGELRGGLSTGHTTLNYTTGTPPVTTPIASGVKQSLAGAAYAVGFLPIGPNFDLLARVGYGASRYNLTPSGVAAAHANEHGIRYGAGAEYFLDGTNGLRVDWTREQMSNFHVPTGLAATNHANVWAVSFVHRFR